MKILNLYAGLGGNRKLWGDEHKIWSIDINRDICEVYRGLYPCDRCWEDDAHEFLRKMIQAPAWDFIWSSPPCQTHSSFRQNICVRYRGTPPVYPDMRAMARDTVPSG
jgi:DNA (cytosine-5)-methyltransferase 1